MTDTDIKVTAQKGKGPTSRRPRTSPRAVSVGRRTASWWWALPGLLLLVLVNYVAVAIGGVYSFTNFRGIGSFEFVGLKNFIRAFEHPFVTKALWNTLFLAGIFLVAVNVIGLLLAMALNRTLKSRHLIRTLLFAPVVLSPLAVAFVWRYIFAYDGPLNEIVGAIFGPEAVTTWLASPEWAIWTVLIVMVWKNIGYTMIIYLAGLASVPTELEEAASIDGANGWTRFFKITLPEIRPAIIVAATLMLIHGLRVFDEVVGLTGGGPYGATETLSTQIWRQTFVAGDFGFGSAIALILTVLIIIFALIQNLALRKRKED